MFTERLEPFEHRKLWLLNGGHSLLAYAGALRGHRTVADAIGRRDLPRLARAVVAGGVARTWSCPAGDVAAYRAALLERFANPRIRHRLAQIAADGSQKLPVRVLPVLRAERRRADCRRAVCGSSPPGCATCGASACPSAIPVLRI